MVVDRRSGLEVFGRLVSSSRGTSGEGRSDDARDGRCRLEPLSGRGWREAASPGRRCLVRCAPGVDNERNLLAARSSGNFSLCSPETRSAQRIAGVFMIASSPADCPWPVSENPVASPTVSRRRGRAVMTGLFSFACSISTSAPEMIPMTPSQYPYGTAVEHQPFCGCSNSARSSKSVKRTRNEPAPRSERMTISSPSRNMRSL